jgi:CRISPR-associated protein Csm5
MSGAAQHLSFHLTPLSPVHVGCGEDYDPTGYVIDDGVLYAFDPAALPLEPRDRQELMARANRPGTEAILGVQRFFDERRTLCQAAARHVVAVAPGVADQYAQRLGRTAQAESGGRRVINALEIERTHHHPHTGVPALPGSSLKGAMRTAWLNGRNQGRPSPPDVRRASELEQHLLAGGAFQTDPFRLLSVGDAAGPAVAAQVLFATNHKKRPVFRDGREMAGQGPAARRECIAAAQFAAFDLDVALGDLGGRHVPGDTPMPAARLPGWAALAAACNGFYLPLLRAELALLEQRQFADPGWVAGLRRLLDALGPALAAADAVLLRVGRHSGAEAVTLEGVRRIRILKGRGQPPDNDGTEATTVWLAAPAENARSGLLPFGWTLLHRRAVDLPALREWCDTQPRVDLAAVQGHLRQARATAAAEAAQRAAREAERQAQAVAAAEQAAREAQRLAALSPAGRAVEALKAALVAHTAARKQPVGGHLYGEVRRLVAEADAGGWGAEDRRALAHLLRTLVAEKIDLGGKARDIRQAASRLADAP